ncbi:hypothetical protein [Thalassotalea atypica]|uniref:hypothetical protein n=1 Tax=Thalassotalea atypica TaxID=2054316 RepID=UPI0025730EFB|nr:hypothetical protein [Thalassotalea atypica]
MMLIRFYTAMWVMLLTACSPTPETTTMNVQLNLDQLAEQYVKLALKIGQHHPSYIDAYYGPASFKPIQEKTSLETLLVSAQELRIGIEKVVIKPALYQRQELLIIQVRSMEMFIRLQLGEHVSFDDESKGLYDAISPTISETQLDSALIELDKLVPGEGELNNRLNHYKKQFVIPLDKLDAVFVAAIDEARKRTKQHIQLPAQENFKIEYVTDKVWSGYNWYKGGNYSVIQLNTDFPIYIDRAIDLASHEGYPGHHVFNSQMEQHLVNNLKWVEFSVYPLFSPQSLLAEGSANYGIEVAFPKAERLAFETEVLFPLAGMDPTQVERYYQIQDKLSLLSYADNMVAKRYLDGEINREQAIELLMKYALSTKEKSMQRIGFIEANRAYVINYNLGQDLVREYVDKMTGNGDHDRRWQVFADLLANPKTASMMKTAR